MIHDAPHWHAKAERLERELAALAVAAGAVLHVIGDHGEARADDPEVRALRDALPALPETTKGEA